MKNMLIAGAVAAALSLPLTSLAASDDELNDIRTQLQGLMNRVDKLEQENAALRAEVAGLRERLRRVEHVETHMVETGRWVSSLPFLGETGE